MTDTIIAGTSTRYTTNAYLKVKKGGGGGVRGEREAGPRGEKRKKRRRQTGRQADRDGVSGTERGRGEERK